MSLKKIWLDCDPGHDDMLAIIMVALSDQTQLLGISTSAGNSYIQNTTQNALNILFEIGRQDVVVVKGAQGPLCRQFQTAENIHGVSGLQGVQLLKSPQKAISDKPFLYIYNLLMSQPEPIDFVVTGAMTNLAILLKAFPDIKTKIKAVTVMGGAIGKGNVSPAAEFNLITDPQAASMVVSAGLPMTMIPLQVTHTVQVSPYIFEELKQLNSSFGRKLVPLFRHFQLKYKQLQDFDYPPAHDPCTIHYLIHPEDFVSRKSFVQIQTEGKSKGRTNFYHMHPHPNVTVCQSINVANFWTNMLKCLRKIKDKE